MTRSENTELLSDLPQDQRLPVSLEQRDSLMRVPRSIILISTCIGLSLFGDQLVYTVLPIIHSEVGITVAQIGFCVSANRFIRILTNVGATVIISKFGRKWPFIISLVIAAIITTAYGFIHGFVAFVVARLIWGMCWSFLRLEGMNTVLDLADNKTKGRFMGFYQSIARLGGSFGMLGGGILTDALGFRSTFSIFGLLTALAPFLAFFEMQKRSLPSSMAIPEAKQSNEQIDTPTTNSLTVPTATVTLISPMEGEKTEEVKTKSLPNKESEKYNLRQSKQDQSTDCEAPSSQNLTLPAKKSVGDLVEELPPTTWQVTILYLCGFSNRLVIDGMCGTLLGFLLKQRYGEEPAIFSTVTVPVASLTGTLLSSRGFIELFVAPLAGHLGDTWGRYGVCLHAFSNLVLVTLPIAGLMVLLLTFKLPIIALTVIIPFGNAAGVTLSVTYNTVAGIMAKASPISRTAFLSRYLSMNDLGSASGSLIGYLIAPRYGLTSVFVSGTLLFAGIFFIFAATFKEHLK